MLVSGSWITDMRSTLPEFLGPFTLKSGVVYSRNPANRPASSRRYFCNNPNTALASLCQQADWTIAHIVVSHVFAAVAECIAPQATVTRRDDR